MMRRHESRPHGADAPAKETTVQINNGKRAAGGSIRKGERKSGTLTPHLPLH